MRGNIFLNLRLILIILDDLPETLAAHALAVHIDKQRLLVGICNDPGAYILYVIVQRTDSSGIKRNDAVLSLAAAVDKACVQIDVMHVQTDQLRDTDTRGIQNLEHGVIPVAFFVHALGLFKE